MACTGTPPAHLGGAGAPLPPCPDTPNCVSSEATDEEHAIPPLAFTGSPEAAWAAAVEAVSALPRTKIVTERPGYLHAECTSLVFRYVDDLELQLRPDENVIEVRSASRLGRSDFGVNRARVERLREALQSRGVGS